MVLSYKGLGRIETLNSKDLKLIFGNHEFLCNRFSASFLSSKIQKLLINDSTIECIYFEDFLKIISKNHITVSYFEHLLSQLFGGEEIIMNEQNQNLLVDLSKVLENDELGLKVIHSYDDLNEENVMSRLNY
ncbi:hypothetical protein TRFO_12558 [Tritrichomonas foetus]|uniref:BTB domain-containing protein n=1 Tax=Tritrichomonas foetus TaxID=1144522 RepID=A0A1J4L1B1_9EUKA|nr:hypothetical protein TRFO_12558 [Tritrichomonas foetus]|eukprot:OHT17227.1 hypothetical protein TRFO_12558 [Tritrichomonas foetus]